MFILKKEMLSEYQPNIPDLYNISIGNVKNFFDKEKYVLHYKNLQIYLRLELKVKKKKKTLRITIVKISKQCYIRKNNGEHEK